PHHVDTEVRAALGVVEDSHTLPGGDGRKRVLAQLALGGRLHEDPLPRSWSLLHRRAAGGAGHASGHDDAPYQPADGLSHARLRAQYEYDSANPILIPRW